MNKTKKVLASSLIGLMGLTSSCTMTGCATFKDVYQEVFRSNEEKNMMPVKPAHGIDYSRETTGYKVINDRGYERGEENVPSSLPEPTPVKVTPEITYSLSEINGTMIEDGKGGVIIQYPCRTPAPDLVSLITSLDVFPPEVKLIAYPNQNQIIIHGKRENFGTDFGRLTTILNSYDIPPVPIRIELRVASWHRDSTYDAESVYKILKDGMSVFTLNLPSGTDPTKPLTMGASVDPFMREPRYHRSPWDGSKIPNQWTYEGAIRALDSVGRVDIVSSIDVNTINGSPVSFKNLIQLPLSDIVATTPGSIIPMEKITYKDIGTEVLMIPYVNEKGFTVLKIVDATVGRQAGYISTVQKPILSSTKLGSDVVLRNGETYIIATALDTENKGVTRGLPLFNKIPLIKDLSTSRTQENSSKELIFFLTVRPLSRDSMTGIEQKVQTVQIEEKIKRKK